MPTTKKAKSAKKQPLALDLLAKDHKAVDRMFQRYEASDDGDGERADLLQAICAALSAHARLEEELFYPALRTALREDGDELLDEAHVEHATIKALVEDLEGAAPGEDMVDAKVKVLSEYVKHHVQEEEDEIFPKARKAKALDLERLGQDMQDRKAALEPRAHTSPSSPAAKPKRKAGTTSAARR
jgi:hemerythrin superfamily protein